MTDSVRRHQANNSTAKTMFSFSKSSRFASPKPNTNALFYDKKDEFSNKRSPGAGKGFNTSSDRFFPTRNGSSDKIDGPGAIDRTGNNFSKT